MNTHESLSLAMDLQVSLQLEVDGKKEEIFASNLEKINLDLHPYGYEGFVGFRTFEQDKIHELFASEKVMKVTVTFKSTDPKKAGAPLLEIQGIVHERSYQTQGKGVQKKKTRSYEIRFTDPAQASWTIHYPIKIFVDQTMKDVLDAEKNPLITLKYDWEALNEVSPILAFSLEFKRGMPKQQQVSFYSFLMWYLEQKNGILEYNIKENSYAILGKKSEEGEPITVPEWSLTSALCQFPDPPRHHKRVIKHSAETQDNQDEENPNGFQAVRKDAFDDTNYHLFPEQVSQATLSTLSPEKPLVRFNLADLAEPFDLDKILPGVLIKIKGNDKLGGVWCEEAAFKDQTFRLREISIHARKTTVSEEINIAIQPFQLEIQVTAESKDEPHIPRPAFNDPVYPFSIPGKIFCEKGDKEQATFNVEKTEKNPLGQYQVVVPLAGADKKVVVPFTPHIGSGQIYLPLCKDQQVMLAMYFLTAAIERVLDWQPLTHLPLDTLAHQIVFFSNGKDNFVVQKLEQKDGKDPILVIKQSSSQDQTQLIQIQEKKILMTVEEKGKNLATIQFDRESGLTLKVKDESSGVTQQTIYNPTSITHTSEGKDGKSTFIQKPDSVSIECKKFTVKCEEGIIEATKTLTQKAANKIFWDAPVINAKDKVKMGG